MNDRIEDESRLWETIPSIPDLQCAWQLLVQSANRRANHSLRTMPPSCTAEHARAHDQGMWQTVETLLDQTPGIDAERALARELATLPMRMGGLGLRSATRCAESAFWASWADALPMISERTPPVVDMMVHAMVGDQPRECLGGVQTTRQGRFLVEAVVARALPGQMTAAEHYRGARRVATRLAVLGFFHFRRALPEDPHTVSPSSHLSRAFSIPLWTQCWSSACLRSHGTRVRDSSTLVQDVAAGKASVASPDRRDEVQRLPQVPWTRWRETERRVRAQAGSGKRATPIERVQAIVCRGAGARVRFNAFLRDMNIGVGVLAQDLPLLRESSTRRGRHAQTCPDAHWRTSPARSRRGWGRPGAGTSRQRNHVPRTDQFRKMPVGGHGD